MGAKRAVTAGVLVGCAAAAAGCGSARPAARPAPPASARPGRTATPDVALYQSPVQATLSWFSAINHKDRPAAIAHFEPASASMMNWGNGDTATWATFTNLRCRQVTGGATTAVVLCTFSESQAPSAGNPDTFWDVSLKLQPGNRWLITNYGQG